MIELPDADDLFRTFFAPWYAGDELARREHPATRPDVEPWAPAGLSALEASPLTLEGQQDAVAQVEGMVAAARGDWPELIDVGGAPSPAWIDAFDRHHDRLAVAAVIATFFVDETAALITLIVYAVAIAYFWFYSRHHLVASAPEEEFAAIQQAEAELAGSSS